jgi:exopolysaccharide biosynthesis WecB/TagA/CpsF family protein
VADRPGTSKVRLLGVDLDPLTEEEVVRHVLDRAGRREGGLVCTANADHLRQVVAGGVLRDLYAGEADLAVADGVPLLWAARLRGTPLPGRVAGSDLLWSLSEGAAQEGVPVYLLGGREGAADTAAATLVGRYPGLVVAGTACPPPGFDEVEGEVARLADELVAHRPGIVFSALGSPKQEVVNARLHRRLPATWFVGVGAAFDMAAGYVRRAPVWVQRAGLEWSYRLAQEPQRLVRRYLVDDLPLVARLLVSAAGERWRE